jgi:predicted nuclease of predicted toxin-antitoxin system
MSIRFHLDEHISASIAAGLRRRNIDVTTAADAGLTGADDATHLAFAASAGRVMVTQDADYLRLHSDGVGHKGIAYCRQGTLAIEQILRNLVLIYDVLTPEEMTNRVEFL